VLPGFDDCLTAADEDCNGTAPGCTGIHAWSKRFGNADEQRSVSVATDSAGNVFVTRYFNGSVDFGGGPLTSSGPGDLFVARYGSTGTLAWSRRFGGLGYQYGSGVAIGTPGNPVVAGYFQTSVDFGSGAFAAAGLYDGFVASLAP
jgi:hypothetical protein